MHAKMKKKKNKKHLNIESELEHVISADISVSPISKKSSVVIDNENYPDLNLPDGSNVLRVNSLACVNEIEVIRVNSFANVNETVKNKIRESIKSVDSVKLDSMKESSNYEPFKIQIQDESPVTKKKKIKMKPKGPNDIIDILNDITNFGYSKIKLLTTQTNDLMHF